MVAHISTLLAVAMGRVHIPIIWVLGGLLIVAGVIDMFRGRVLRGIIWLVLGLILGGLNLLVFI